MQKGLLKWCWLKREQRKAANRLRHACHAVEQCRRECGMRFANATTSRFSRILFGDGVENGQSQAACPQAGCGPVGTNNAAVAILDLRQFIKPFCIWYYFRISSLLAIASSSKPSATLSALSIGTVGTPIEKVGQRYAFFLLTGIDRFCRSLRKALFTTSLRETFSSIALLRSSRMMRSSISIVVRMLAYLCLREICQCIKYSIKTPTSSSEAFKIVGAIADRQRDQASPLRLRRVNSDGVLDPKRACGNDKHAHKSMVSRPWLRCGNAQPATPKLAKKGESIDIHQLNQRSRFSLTKISSLRLGYEA